MKGTLPLDVTWTCNSRICMTTVGKIRPERERSARQHWSTWKEICLDESKIEKYSGYLGNYGVYLNEDTLVFLTIPP
jgi:hypothetical protein